MKDITFFDVLVVYNHHIATSASLTGPSADFPFLIASKRANYNDSYAYFLEMCAKNNLRAAFTTSGDLTNEGNFKSYWLFQNKKWIKVNKPCFSELIFDKFSPVSEEQKKRRVILFSDPKVKPFNNPKLLWLFFDKQKTYERLKSFAIPTVPIENDRQESVDRAVDSLKNIVEIHPNRNDFSKKVVVKDRFGAGGNNIYCVGNYDERAKIFDILQKNKNTLFVLQPFVKFDKGFSYKNYSGFIDTRLIFLRSQVIQVYIRIAKNREFRCNEHQGGSLVYISKKEVPKKVLDLADKIVNILDERDSLYALDFIISNSGNVYLMEGNSGPGLDWNLSLRKNEQKAKKLIRLIVIDLARRIRYQKSTQFI